MAAPGKWGDPTLPKHGWICEEIRDLAPDDGTPFEDYHAICEMCERKRIRYQHVMTHPKWPECICAGVICSGKMENNKAAAKRREREERNRCARRQRWPYLRAWKKSETGNHHISRNGIHILVHRKMNRPWRIRVRCEHLGGEHWGERQFATLEQAKLRSFDAYEYARDRWGWGS